MTLNIGLNILNEQVAKCWDWYITPPKPYTPVVDTYGMAHEHIVADMHSYWSASQYANFSELLLILTEWEGQALEPVPWDPNDWLWSIERVSKYWVNPNLKDSIRSEINSIVFDILVESNNYKA